MQSEIISLRTKKTWKTVTVPGYYKFTPRGRFKGLQTWVWNKLIEHGFLKEATRRDATYEVVHINTRDFMEKLLAQKQEVFEQCMTPRTLIIGSRDFDELMRRDTGGTPFGFQSWYYQPGESYELAGKTVRNPPQLCGLTVKVIPWMKGMVVLP